MEKPNHQVGEWTFTFEAERGQRLMKRFRSCTTFAGLWYCRLTRKFVPTERKLPKGGSNHSPPIKSFKAFKRFLRKHPELIGSEVILVSRYIGHNIKANWTQKEPK